MACPQCTLQEEPCRLRLPGTVRRGVRRRERDGSEASLSQVRLRLTGLAFAHVTCNKPGDKRRGEGGGVELQRGPLFERELWRGDLSLFICRRQLCNCPEARLAKLAPKTETPRNSCEAGTEAQCRDEPKEVAFDAASQGRGRMSRTMLIARLRT